MEDASDWDECNEDCWRLRGNFLRYVDELEKECPLTVSIKQLWYDLQQIDSFKKAGGVWKCRDEALWKKAMLELFDRYFMMTVDQVCYSLGSLTELELDTVEKGKLDHTGTGAVVATKCDSIYGNGGTRSQLGEHDDFHLDDSKSKHESFNLQSENRGWLSAENVIVSDPEFSPDVIFEYLQISENLRKNLTQKLRKHLLYLGWKIEYRKEPLMTRMRYISPVGKVYMSLVKICEDMVKNSGTLCVLSEDKGSQTQLKFQSREMLLDQSDESRKPKVPSATSTWDLVVFEPEFCPEAIENWCKYLNSNGSLQNRCRETDSLKAKKHLSAMGWTFYYAYKETKRELRYVSPRGKICYSLRKACEDCILDTANDKFETSERGKPSKNMSIISSDVNQLYSPVLSSPSTTSQVKCSLMHETTPNLLNMGLEQQQQHDRVERNQFGVEESLVTRQNKKLDVVPKHSGGEKKQSKAQARHASKSVFRGSKRIREAASHNPSHNNPRTVLAWLIDRNVVLPKAQVQYICRKNGQSLKSGQVSREGIWCDCCGKIYSLSAFESHAGSSVRRPSANIFLGDGRSLMECQRQMLSHATEKKSDQKFERAYPENDVLCCICHYAGELMLCDRCPASFHVICLGLKKIPDGDWFCPSCRCALCGLGEFNDTSSEGDVLRCYQCEHQFHLSCLRKRGEASIEKDAKGNIFCSAKCKKICSGLNELLGKPFELGSDCLTWTLVAANKCGSSRPDLAEMDTLTENHSKLNVALSIIHECFEPLKDYRTKRDIVEDVIFSRSSEYSRLNYRGFYTVILEQNEELITAATVRIFGDKVAEVPLVGTRFQYRRLGMCRFLMNELERKLTGLGIERLVLPAVPGVLETWTNSFGFSQMTELERLQFLSYTFLDFVGTTMCQKFLQDKAPGNPTPSGGAQRGTKSNKIVERPMPDEPRTRDDSAVLVDQIRTYSPCTREVLTQTSELLQVRSAELSISRQTLPSEQGNEILNMDHQATNTIKKCFEEQNSCMFPPSRQTSLICRINREEVNVPEMVQDGECWKELINISEMHQSEHEEQRHSTDQRITGYRMDDKSSKDTASLVYLALPAIPSTAGQTSQEEHKELNINNYQHIVSTNECVQDESSTSSSITSINRKRKKGCLDISNLKVYRRRENSG